MLLCVAGIIILFGQGQWPIELRGPLALIPTSMALLLAYKWQKSERRSLLRFLEGLLWIMLYVIAWSMGGIIIYLFVQNTGNRTLDIWHAIYIWTLTGAIGALIVFIPAGLGIREITLTWLLQPYVPTATAIMIAIILRLIFILGDLGWGIIVWQVSRFFSNR